VSDGRETEAAHRILACVGAERTGDTGWTEIQGDGRLIEGTFKLARPAHEHGPFSFGLDPVDTSAVVVAKNPAGTGAIVAGRSEAREGQDIFIDVLTRASARVVPFPWTARYYTGESLHPTFHIPEMYWPKAGFDRIKATVRVTRPLRGLGSLAAEAGARERTQIAGDAVEPRHGAHIRLDRRQTGRILGAVFDDGTNGDGTANDHYWERSLPADVAKVDGEYEFHTIFELCRASDCVRREARHKTIVEVKMSPRASAVTPTTQRGQTRNTTRILLTPRDDAGNLMGPGLTDRLLVGTEGDVKIDRVGEVDGRGAYEIVVNWAPSAVRPEVSISQFGRPTDAIRVPLQ
jgi:hypothetical protein